jgi:hypothetical protein
MKFEFRKCLLSFEIWQQVNCSDRLLHGNKPSRTMKLTRSRVGELTTWLCVWSVFAWSVSVRYGFKNRGLETLTESSWLSSVSAGNRQNVPCQGFAKLWKATIYLMSSCLSARMEQLGSHWTNFPEISNLSVFRKSVEKFQISLKSEKSNGYFTRRPLFIFETSLSSC